MRYILFDRIPMIAVATIFVVPYIVLILASPLFAVFGLDIYLSLEHNE